MKWYDYIWASCKSEKKRKKKDKQQTNPLHKQLAREKSTLELIIKILGW